MPDNISLDTQHSPDLIKGAAIKHHFLFTEHLYVSYYIKHIKFNKFFNKPNKKFPLPPVYNRHTHRSKYNRHTHGRKYNRHTHGRKYLPIDDLEEIFLSEDDNSPWLAPRLALNSTEPQSIIAPPPIEVAPLNPSSTASSLHTPIEPSYSHEENLRKQQETTINRRAYKDLQLHVKSLFTYPWPTPLSMLSASVEEPLQTYFSPQSSDDFMLYDDLSIHDQYIRSRDYIMAYSATLTDLQDNFHAHMTNSPIHTFSPTVSKEKPRAFPLLTAQINKRPLLLALTSQDVKCIKLLLE
ncbi:hypothetical protein C1645_826248 [Glomus cerebriforme]|uniref:Uncharacterized protein n=1 Tax=Glomus cerebriforme TaxID=658196 RepID=A0A397SWY2_9GLOM|nr:hypothetical protein C1645_826248 [Glomus cerebriforme]